MKLRRYFILNLGLAFLASFGNQVTAQTLPKDSTAAVQEQQPIAQFHGSPTNSVLDGVSLARPVSPGPASVFPASGSYVSPWLVDIVKLIRARIEDGVIVTFIDSAGSFNLDAEQIIYLRDLGLSNDLLAIMIQHDTEIISGLRPIPAAPSGSPATVHLGPGEPKVASSPAPSIVSIPLAAKNVSVPTAVPKIFENIGDPAEGLVFAKDKQSDEIAMDVPYIPTTPSLPLTISPVRQPYPVQLLDPIVMIRAQGRPANLMLLEMR
jgi:hypothetical protein